MAIHVPRVLYTKQILRKNSFTERLTCPTTADVPKGYCAVYVGQKERKRFLTPVTFLNQPWFQDLLSQAEEEFGFDIHPTGGLTIQCREEILVDLTSRLSRLVL